MCTQHTEIRKGKVWEMGWGAQFIVSCSCIRLEFFTSFLPGTVNHTNHIRKGNGLFWKLFLKQRNEKKTTHKSANFQIVTCNLLTFSHLHPIAAVRMPVRQQQQSGVSWKKPRCDFFPPVIGLFNIKNFCDANLYGKAAVLRGMLECRNAGFSWKQFLI